MPWPGSGVEAWGIPSPRRWSTAVADLWLSSPTWTGCILYSLQPKSNASFLFYGKTQ